MALQLAAIADGVTSVAFYGYGPLYLRQVLHEQHLLVVALVNTLAALATFIAAGIWGRLSDRTGKPLPLMATGLFGMALALLLIPFMPSSTGFLLMGLLLFTMLAAVSPLGVAWSTTLAPDHPSEQAALFYRMRSAGWAVGSFGCSALVHYLDSGGITVAFRLGTALTALAGISLLLYVTGEKRRLRKKEERVGPDQPDSSATLDSSAASDPSASPRPQSTASNFEGLSAGLVWRLPIVAAIAGAVLFAMGGNEAFFSLLGPYLTEELRVPSSWVGLTLGTASVLNIAITRLAGRFADRHGPTLVFLIGTWSYTIIFAAMIIFGNPFLTMILYALPISALISTGASGALSTFVPAHQRAEAIGAFEGSVALSMATGSLLSGWVVDQLGLHFLPAITFAITVPGALIAWFAVYRRFGKQKRREYQ